MNQQGHLIPNALPASIAAVSSSDYVRIYRHGTTARYYGLKFDGTSELINAAGTPFAVTGGSANNYTYIEVDTVPPYNGQVINVMINVQNTGSSTINVNGIGPVSILKQNSVAVASGDLKAGYVYSLIYITNGETSSYNVISSL